MIHRIKHRQSGTTLIEVLIALLLFSVGILSVGIMLTYAVQLPKFAAYRATATLLASGHIERMRANRTADHRSDLNFDGSFTPLTVADCPYPNCTDNKLTAMDKASTQKFAREQLPAGGLLVTCTPPTSDTLPCTTGDLWLVWQEPNTLAAFKAQSSGECPKQVTDRLTKPAPRCLHVRFSL